MTIVEDLIHYLILLTHKIVFLMGNIFNIRTKCNLMNFVKGLKIIVTFKTNQNTGHRQNNCYSNFPQSPF